MGSTSAKAVRRMLMKLTPGFPCTASFFRSTQLQNHSSEINSVKVSFFKLIFKLILEVYAKILVGNSKVDSKLAKEPFLVKIFIKVILGRKYSLF